MPNEQFSATFVYNYKNKLHSTRW